MGRVRRRRSEKEKKKKKKGGKMGEVLRGKG